MLDMVTVLLNLDLLLCLGILNNKTLILDHYCLYCFQRRCEN